MSSNKKSQKVSTPFYQKTWVQFFIVVLIGLITFIVYQNYQQQEQAEQRRAAVEKQREINITAWQNQGLSEKEIEAKLEENRQERIDRGDQPFYTRMYRTTRRALGLGGSRGQGRSK